MKLDEDGVVAVWKQTSPSTVAELPNSDSSRVWSNLNLFYGLPGPQEEFAASTRTTGRGHGNGRVALGGRD